MATNTSQPPTSPSLTQAPVASEKAVPGSPDSAKLAPRMSVAERKPFGGFTKKLDIAVNCPGYVIYWINDEPGRIPTCLNAGFEFVDAKEVVDYNPQLDGSQQNSSTDSRVSRPTKRRNADGSVMLMYLMKLPQEFFEQDEKAKQERQAQIDRAIVGGGVAVPRDGTAYRPEVGRPTIQTQIFPSGQTTPNPTGMNARPEKTMTGLG